MLTLPVHKILWKIVSIVTRIYTKYVSMLTHNITLYSHMSSFYTYFVMGTVHHASYNKLFLLYTNLFQHQRLAHQDTLGKKVSMLWHSELLPL